MSSGTGSPAKAILYAFLVNTGIACAKLAAAIYTSSGSMLAEAIHSMADSGNQVLLYIGLRGAERPADANHPMGYGKLSMTPGITIETAVDHINRLEARIKAEHPTVGWCFIEPDNKD
jgi:divalent metal cation (Fe/Co/Zn/Cd) transporter